MYHEKPHFPCNSLTKESLMGCRLRYARNPVNVSPMSDRLLWLCLQWMDYSTLPKLSTP